MGRFIIEGGHPLRGTVVPSGNKNAALPILAASLLTDQEIRIKNLPHIQDVETMLEILASLGVEVKQLGKEGVALRARNIRKTNIEPDLAARMRASVLLAGPLLARCKKATLPPPGGDLIGRRRVDTHIMALRALGARVEVGADYKMEAKNLRGNDIFLDEASVTGTENAIMAATLAPGTTVIRNAASEPHVQDLGRFLSQLGAKVSGLGSNTLVIEGVDNLRGGDFEIAPDHIEVGSLVACAAVTRGEVLIKNAAPENMGMILLIFRRLGIEVEVQGQDIFVPRQEQLKIVFDAHGAIPKIDDAPWPGFPADLMSIAIVVATQAEGTVLFFEKLFETRMFFVDKLISMGARLILCDPHRVVVVGPSRLHGEGMESPDIRAGMALVAASLCAEGQSIIKNIGQVDRGYEQVDNKLRALGAKIERVED
jgi:UDP-N-acetylglucosamine 1-carboxyvinyltransferase